MPEQDRGPGGRFVSNRMAPKPPDHGWPARNGAWMGVLALLIIIGGGCWWFWSR